MSGEQTVRDATPPQNEWTEFFTDQVRERDDTIRHLRERIEYVEGVLSRDPFDETQREFAARLLRETLGEAS